MSNDCCAVQLPESKQCVIIKSILRTIADNTLRSVLLIFYGSMEKKGLCFKEFCVSHLDNRQKNKNKNFKVTENKVVIKISTHPQ